ncbi:MAG: YchJ family protein [Proteobacteria bacterium]|nr:YchJ family protein [Pseudomonadota bacterium]
MITSASPCPCGAGSNYGACCEPFHLGKSKPDTAEKLMRSRYSAYVAAKIDYIGKTNDPETGGDFDAEAAETWSKESEWMGLEIVATREGQKGDASGEVEFKARYRAQGVEETHHEVSLFRFDRAQGWLYRDGKTLRTPVQRAEPKIGRNDPCSCGSGKKYKKCCG